jgi:hypothetical protein
MRNRHITWISKDGTVARRVRYTGRGARKVSATSVKVAGISMSIIKAEELDSPLAGRAGVVILGGTIPTSAAAGAAAGAAAESSSTIVSSRKESDKSSKTQMAWLIRVSVSEERWQWEY